MVDDAFPILSGPCGAGAQGWLGVVRRRGRSLGGEVKMTKGAGGSALHREIPPIRSAVFAALHCVPGLTRGREGSWEVVLAKVRGQTTAWQRRCGVQQESVCNRRKAGTKSLRLEAAWCSQETDELGAGAQAGKDAPAAEVCLAEPYGTLYSSWGL